MIPAHLAIPVIDLKGGIVVRAVGGDRKTYAPLQSPLVSGCEPLAVARALAERVGHNELYVADLDALAGAPPAWRVHRNLLAAGLDLWLDVGLADVQQARTAADLSEDGLPLYRIIAALESLPDVQTLGEMARSAGPQRLAFSLDLRGGEPLSAVAALRSASPLALVEAALAVGIRCVIVVDVGAVGTGQGPPVAELCRQIRSRAPFIELIAGGGVRGREDVVALHDAGCNAVLVSTWLHRYGGPHRLHDTGETVVPRSGRSG